jgi:hypothetical protein
MAGWTNSKIFTSFITDKLNNTTAISLGSDALIEVALYNNSVTPDQTVTSANTAYSAGVWTGGSAPNLVDTGTSAPAGWPYLGRPLASATSTFTSNVYSFGAANTASANATTTLTAAYGCLVYDKTITTPVSGQGICFNYFGGTNTVTLGTFTVVWSSGNILQITV